jgi:hypothetical protein
MAERNAVNRSTVIDSLVFIGTSVLCLFEGYRLNATSDPRLLFQELQPGYYVLFLGAILLVTGLVYLIRNLRAVGPEVVTRTPEQRATGAFVVGAIIAAVAGYAILIATVGYFVGSAVFFIAMLAIFKVKPLATLAIGLALAGVFYAVFVLYLNIIFPRAMLF